MRVAYVLSGVPASGKSTYVNNHIKTVDRRTIVFSSDKIREKLFGDLTNLDIYTKANHAKVFEELHKRIRKTNAKSIIVDSTNLSRKSRRNLYGLLKLGSYKVVIITFIEPLSVLLDRNIKREIVVPEQSIREMYKRFEPPRVGVDCDEYRVVTTTPFLKTNAIDFLLDMTSSNNILKTLQHHINKDYLLELNNTDFEIPHDTPYHLETIEQHIQMCLDNIECNSDLIIPLDFIAAFHDLGKYVTKQKGRYYNHQNVSAMYALNALSTNPDIQKHINKTHIEVIFMHMLAHGGISKKTIDKHELTTEELTLLDMFKDIDERSRVTHID